MKILLKNYKVVQITTLEELAEQGVDDLADIEELTAEQAADFIMAARNICWFSEE